MKLKRAFSVFIDNFNTTYKLLLYKLIVLAIFGWAYFLIVSNVVSSFLDTAEFNNLYASVSSLFSGLIEGKTESLTIVSQIKSDWETFLPLLIQGTWRIFLGVVLIILIYTVQHFLMGLGDYAASALVNDKMSLQAKSPFINTYIKNFSKACIYNAVFAPLNVFYNVIVIGASYLLFFMGLSFMPILFQAIAFASTVVFAVSVKKAYLSGWMPAILSGQMGCLEALKFSFKMQKGNFWNTVSDFIVLNFVVLSVVVASAIFTLGSATVLVIPASTILLIAYQFVDYFTVKDMKYFIDEDTIVKPKKEHKLTREEFFKGEK